MGCDAISALIDPEPETPECESGIYDECDVCDGPGKVPETNEDCGWVTDCGYVTVALDPEDYYCTGWNWGIPCTSNADCNNAGGGASTGGSCMTCCQQVWQCEDVYECDEYTVYECPD